MATFSETAFKAKRDVWSTHKTIFSIMTGPVSYATGGDPIATTDFSFGTIDGFIPLGVAWNGTAGRILFWDVANQKVIWIVPNTGSEVANATDLSAYTCPVLVAGQG